MESVCLGFPSFFTLRISDEYFTVRFPSTSWRRGHRNPRSSCSRHTTTIRDAGLPASGPSPLALQRHPVLARLQATPSPLTDQAPVGLRALARGLSPCAKGVSFSSSCHTASCGASPPGLCSEVSSLTSQRLEDAPHPPFTESPTLFYFLPDTGTG